MKIVVCLLLAFVSSSCAKDETLPPIVSSAGLAMDGSHFVPFSGAPDEFGQSKSVDNSRVPGGWSTPPVALPSGGFAIGSKAGQVFIFNDQDSLARSFDVGDRVQIDQLLLDRSSIYAVSSIHTIYCVDTIGHTKWKARIDTLITAPAVFADGQIVVPTQNGLVALSAASGAIVWTYHTTNEMSSVALNAEAHQIVGATTSNDFEANDSIVILSNAGKLLRMFPVAGRITSNIALCGKDKNSIAIGLARGSGNQKQIRGVLYDVVTGKLLQEHTIPYFANSVGANSESYITSGFRTSAGELSSGIDAFSLSDTLTRWSRRFSEPVTAPLAVSDGSVYFALSFETSAIVGSKGLFYALDAGNGKTVLEHALSGALDGFVPGMPMPDRAGRLMLADRARPVIYLLNRTAFHRMF